MAHLDFKTFYEMLANEVRTSTDFTSSMQKLLDWGKRTYPHESWAALEALDFSNEPTRVEKWLERVLSREPSPFLVRAAYFGLGERETRAKVEYADLYFGLMSEYDPSDTRFSWLGARPKHYPSNSYFRSKQMKAAGVICNEDQEFGLSTPGYIVFSLSFSALLLRFSLNDRIYRILGGTEPIGVVVGFDSGDWLKLGELQESGFVIAPQWNEC